MSRDATRQIREPFIQQELSDLNGSKPRKRFTLIAKITPSDDRYQRDLEMQVEGGQALLDSRISRDNMRDEDDDCEHDEKEEKGCCGCGKKKEEKKVQWEKIDLAIANIYDHLDEDCDETFSMRKDDDDDEETEMCMLKKQLVKELENPAVKEKYDGIGAKYLAKGKTYLTIKDFIKEMREFKETEIDWFDVEDRLYQQKCGSCCRRTCCCFKGLCKSLRYKMRKGRLDNMAKKNRKGNVDFLIYSLVQLKDAYDFYTDAKLALVCYGISRGNSLETWNEKLKFALIFAWIFIAIASPYLIYYSAYMRLVLFKDSYAINKWTKLGCFGKVFLILNLTCIGGLSFVVFDLTSKFTAIVLLVSLFTVPCCKNRCTNRVYRAQKHFLEYVFKLDEQDIKAFETQKKVAIAMFEDLPLLVIQFLIQSDILQCKKEFAKQQQLGVVVRSLFMTILNIIMSFILLSWEAKRFKEPFADYSLNCMRAKQGWVPFAEKLRLREVELNINYNRFLSKLPWVTDVTGHYARVDFDFSDFTLEALTHDLVLAKSASGGGKSPCLVFYQSVDSCDMSTFLHFVDSFTGSDLKMSLKYINWDRLLRNGKNQQSIEFFKAIDSEGKELGKKSYIAAMSDTERALKSVRFYGKSLSGKPLLEICADNEPKCTDVEKAKQVYGPEEWPLKDCFTDHLLWSFDSDLNDTYGEKTLLDHCRKMGRVNSFKLLLANWRRVITIPSNDQFLEELEEIPYKFDGADEDGDKHDLENIQPWAIPFEEDDYFKIRITSALKKGEQNYDKTYMKKDMKLKDLCSEAYLKDHARVKEYGVNIYICMNEGADPNRTNKDGTTPLGCCIRNWQNSFHQRQILKSAKKQDLPKIKIQDANLATQMMYINILVDTNKERKQNNDGGFMKKQLFKELDPHLQQVKANRSWSSKRRSLMTPMYFIIYNEMFDMRKLFQDNGFYQLQKDNEKEAGELLEMLPRMWNGCKKFDPTFRNEVAEFYKSINFWRAELEHGDNFMHILIRDFDLLNPNGGAREQGYITFEELFDDMKNKYEQKDHTENEQEFKKEILKLMREPNLTHEGTQQSPLDILIQNINYSKSKASVPKARFTWIEGWLKLLVEEQKGYNGDPILNDAIFKEFCDMYKKLSAVGGLEASKDRFSDDTLCSLYEMFKNPQEEYNRILKYAVEKSTLGAFEKYMKVEKYHLQAIQDHEISANEGEQPSEIKQLQQELKKLAVDPEEFAIKPFEGQLVRQDDASQEQQAAPVPYTEAVLTLFLEGLACADFVSDLKIMCQMIVAQHTMWFSLSLLSMLCPFLMGYGSLVSLKIAEIKSDLTKQKEQQKEECLDHGSTVRNTEILQKTKVGCWKTTTNLVYLSPMIILYLFLIDIMYMGLTIIILPIIFILKLFCRTDKLFIYDYVMEKILEYFFKMSKMDVLGFRRQRTVLQFTYESIPQIMLQTRILVFLMHKHINSSTGEEEKKVEIQTSDIIWSIFFALLHLLLELLSLRFEAKAVNTRLITYLVVCFNARQGWIPFQAFFKPQTPEIKEQVQRITKHKKQIQAILSKKTQGKNNLSQSKTTLAKSLTQYKNKPQHDHEKPKCSSVKSTTLDEEEVEETGIIEFENCESSICGVNFPLEFEFSDATATMLIKQISNLKQKRNEKDLDGKIVSFDSMKPNLRLGRSFNEIRVDTLIQLISICSQRVKLEITDINMKGILEKSPAYIEQLKDPKTSKCTDFIEVVRASGCHQLIGLMLEFGADFKQLYEEKIIEKSDFKIGDWEAIPKGNIKNCKGPLEIAWVNRDTETMGLLMQQPNLPINNASLKEIFVQFPKLTLEDESFVNSFNTLAVGEGIFIPHWFRDQFVEKVYEINHDKINYLDLVLILWTLFGPDLPPKLFEMTDLQTLQNISKYMKRLGNASFVLTDSKEEKQIDAKFLFNFSRMRNLINEEGYYEDKEEQERIMKQEQLPGKSNMEMCIENLAHIKKSSFVMIPGKYDCKVTDLEHLHRILYATKDKQPELTVRTVKRLDKIVENLGLDINRDKYFSVTRNVLNNENFLPVPGEAAESLYSKKYCLHGKHKISVICGPDIPCSHEYRIQTGPMDGVAQHKCKICGVKIADQKGKQPNEAFKRCDTCNIDICSACHSKTDKIQYKLNDDPYELKGVDSWADVTCTLLAVNKEGEIIKEAIYKADTYKLLQQALDYLPPDAKVAMAIRHTEFQNIDKEVRDMLQTMGSTKINKLTAADLWAFIGVKGKKIAFEKTEKGKAAEVQNLRELSVKIPEDVLAIKSVKIEITNLVNAMIQVKVVYPFCSYTAPFALKDKVYKQNYHYENQNIPNPSFIRAKDARRLFKALINDVKAGHELVFSFLGPPGHKCDCVNIELEFCKQIDIVDPDVASENGSQQDDYSRRGSVNED